jgi:hypothetical protein
LEKIIMRQIPVDTTQVRFIGTGKGVARAKYTDEDASGNRKRIKDQYETDDQGRTIYVVDCLVQDDNAERAEIASVKVPGFSEPTVAFGDVVEFAGLVAVPYVQNGRVMMSFRANGIVDRTNAPKKDQAA